MVSRRRPKPTCHVLPKLAQDPDEGGPRLRLCHMLRPDVTNGEHLGGGAGRGGAAQRGRSQQQPDNVVHHQACVRCMSLTPRHCTALRCAPCLHPASRCVTSITPGRCASLRASTRPSHCSCQSIKPPPPPRHAAHALPPFPSGASAPLACCIYLPTRAGSGGSPVANPM